MYVHIPIALIENPLSLGNPICIDRCHDLPPIVSLFTNSQKQD